MLKSFLFPIFCLILITGCAREQLQPTVTLEEFQENAALSSPSFQANRLAPPGNIASIQSIANEDTITGYVLAPGDLITITVFESEELNAETRISSRGDISMPLLGRVHVTNLTLSEAEKTIEDALVKNYMHTAHVSLFIEEKVNQHLTMVGAVRQPGTFAIQSRKDILEVLLYAGGLLPNAGDTAYVTRKDENGTDNEVFLVDLDALLTQGRIDMNMRIQGGDVIFIPQSDMIQVDGAVRRAGSFKIDNTMTIDNAIASAGGLAVYADEDDIKLIRKNKEGRREIVQLTMGDILSMRNSEGTSDSQPLQELLLRDGDVIFVEASGTRSLYTGAGFSIGFMGTGVSYRNPVK